MKRSLLILLSVLTIAVLAGCASTRLDTPCPHFGKHCKKIPVNSWNYNQ